MSYESNFAGCHMDLAPPKKLCCCTLAMSYRSSHTGFPGCGWSGVTLDLCRDECCQNPCCDKLLVFLDGNQPPGAAAVTRAHSSTCTAAHRCGLDASTPASGRLSEDVSTRASVTVRANPSPIATLPAGPGPTMSEVLAALCL